MAIFCSSAPLWGCGGDTGRDDIPEENDDDSTRESFSVPEGGGVVSVRSGSGPAVELEFPASAAGMALELTSAPASSIGWPEGQFSAVIDMQPHGTTFADPVIVRPANDSDIVLHFSSYDGVSPPELLEPPEGADGLALDHFSALAMLPGSSCTEVNPYDSDLPLLPCLSLTSSYAMFECRTDDNCVEINVSCCTSTLPASCPLLSDRRRQRLMSYDSRRGPDGRCGGDRTDGPGAGGGGGSGDPGTGGTSGTSTGDPGAGGTSGSGTAGNGDPGTGGASGSGAGDGGAGGASGSGTGNTGAGGASGSGAGDGGAGGAGSGHDGSAGSSGAAGSGDPGA